MFNSLSEKLESAFKHLKGQARINELNVANTLKDIRKALLDADVNFKIAKEFTDKVKDKAIGEKVINAISPGQLMVKIVQDELTALMGADVAQLDTSKNPTIIFKSPPDNLCNTFLHRFFRFPSHLFHFITIQSITQVMSWS